MLHATNHPVLALNLQMQTIKFLDLNKQSTIIMGSSQEEDYKLYNGKGASDIRPQNILVLYLIDNDKHRLTDCDKRINKTDIYIYIYDN